MKIRPIESYRGCRSFVIMLGVMALLFSHSVFADWHPYALEPRKYQNELLESLSPVLDYLSLCKDAKIDWTTSIPISNPPEQVREAGIRGFKENRLHTYYSDVSDELIDSISDYFNNKSINCPKENIKIRYTSFDVLRDLYENTKLNEDDTMLIVAPTFGFYILQAAKYDIKTKLVFAKKSNNYKITPDELDRALVATNARILLFTNPVNPTGVFYTKEDVERLSKVIKKHDVFLISDEIFSEIQYDLEKPYSFAAVDGMSERTLTLSGVGKSMGIRLSFACSSQSYISRLPDSGILSPIQLAAIEALKISEGNQSYLESNKDKYVVRINFVHRYISKMNKELNKFYGTKNNEYVQTFIDPKSTNIFLISFPGVFGKLFFDKKMDSSLKLASYIYEKVGVATVPGEGFFIDGSEMVLRIPLSVKQEELEKGLKLILESLKV